MDTEGVEGRSEGWSNRFRDEGLAWTAKWVAIKLNRRRAVRRFHFAMIQRCQQFLRVTFLLQSRLNLRLLARSMAWSGCLGRVVRCARC